MRHLFIAFLILCPFQFALAQGNGEAKPLTEDHALIGAWALDTTMHQNADGVQIIAEPIDPNKYQSEFDGAFLPDSLIVYCKYLIFNPTSTPSTISYMEMDGYFLVALTYTAKVDNNTIYGESKQSESVIMSNLNFPFSFQYELIENDSALRVTVHGETYTFRRI